MKALLLAVVLSIIKANGWFIIPTYLMCIIWISCSFYFIVYCYAKTISDNIDKKYVEEIKRLNEENKKLKEHK